MLAEDLLLLLYDTRRGRPRIHSSRLDLALGGAVLAELTHRRRIALSAPRRLTQDRTVTVTDTTSTGDDVLDAVVQRLASRPATRSQVVVSRISPGLRGRLLERLAGRGLLRPHHTRFGGVVPTTVWRAVDPGHGERLQQDLRQVLRGGRPPTRDEAALISLLHAVGRTANVLGDAGPGRRELERRAKTIAEGDAAGGAVRQALSASAF